MDPHNNQCSDSDRLRAKVRLMITYGGTLGRNPYKKLFYIGGDTRVLVINRHIKFTEIIGYVNSLCNFNTTPYELRYLFPGEQDLDDLVTVANDEDVENMMDEYDCMEAITTTTLPKMRLFVIEPTTQCVTLLQRSDSLNPDYLFGFDKKYDPNATPDHFEVPEFPDERDFGYQENQKEKQVEQQKDHKKHLTAPAQHKTPQCVQVLQRIDSLILNYLFGFDKEYDLNATPDELDKQENQKEKQENQKEKQLTAEERQAIIITNRTCRCN